MNIEILKRNKRKHSQVISLVIHTKEQFSDINLRTFLVQKPSGFKIQDPSFDIINFKTLKDDLSLTYSIDMSNEIFNEKGVYIVTIGLVQEGKQWLCLCELSLAV